MENTKNMQSTLKNNLTQSDEESSSFFADQTNKSLNKITLN